MNMDPVMEVRSASLLLIFGAASPCMPCDYRTGPSETMKTFEKTSTCLFEDEPAHLTVPFAPGPNDEDVTAVFKAESVKQTGIGKLTQ
jgi:hypothetical protein